MQPTQHPMPPWPGLEAYAGTVHLAQSGLRLFLHQAGAGTAPALVLIHGLGDEADTWRHLIPALSSQARVIAPDLPGFGRSDKPARAYDLPFFEGVLGELLDSLDLPRASLAGHSLGALIAQYFALRRPERVERLILIGGSLAARPQKPDLGMLLFLLPGLGEWLYNRLRRDPQAAYRSLAPFYADLERLPEAERAFLFQRVNQRVWSDGQRRAFLSTLRHLARWLPRRQGDLAARLARLALPTLVIWGEADRINPAGGGRALVELQATARLVLIPGAGHNVHQEKPEAVLEAIQSCLRT